MQRAQVRLFGLYQHQGAVGITTATDEYPDTVTLLAKYMCVVDTEFQFTSIQLSRDYAPRPVAASRVSRNDNGMCYVVSLGRFAGGELWVHWEEGDATWEDVPERAIRLRGRDVSERYKSGEVYCGRVLDVFQTWT